jgi:leucyl aminopeptidase (aminopeptidase T)
VSSGLEPAAARAVERVGVGHGERVAVVHNPEQEPIADAIAQAGREAGAEVFVCCFAPLDRHGQEPPAEVATVIAGADVMFAPTAKSLSHARARVEATRRGARFASLPMVTEDIFRRMVPVDYSVLEGDGDEMAALLTAADACRITSDAGTDIVLGLSGRDGRNDDGDLRAAGAFGNLPAGEAYIAPREDAGTGTLVFDGSLAGYGLLREPLTVRMQDGVIVDASGEAAGWLLSSLDAGGANGRRVAELGIGTNPAAVLSGNVLEDEKLRGTAHVAFGGNTGIGGINEAQVHLDIVMLAPTVVIGTTTVIDAGRLVLGG